MVKYYFNWVFFVVSLGTIFTLGSCADSTVSGGGLTAEEESQAKKDSVIEDTYLYDIKVNGYEVYKEKVKKDQNLSDIMLPLGVEYVKIIEMSNKSKEVFDVRRINYGRSYTVLRKPSDTIQEPAYFIYENSTVDYVVFDFLKDSVYAGKKNIYNERKFVTGTINSSLSDAIVNSGANYLLTFELSEIYAWTIDFFKLQKGDAFKVIYSENFVEGKSIGVDKIVACVFQHTGEDYYGFYFDQDSTGDYFDERAESLRKAFLKAPVKFSRISSKYNLKRYHPVLKRVKPHLGTDYAAPHGTPIVSVGDGVVIKAGYTKGNGNFVKVRHNHTYTTQYLHMSKFASGIKKGTRVRQGDVIGYVGSTGLATGPHVCFRFWMNDKQVDPFKIKIPPSKPVSPDKLEAFEQLMAPLMEELNKEPVNPGA